MTRVKTEFAAGRFYSANKDYLITEFEEYAKNHKADYLVTSRAVIVPHAGYIYSGQLAFDAFCLLDKNVKNIFIFGPTHKKSVNNLALVDYDEWETPLGNVKVNTEIQQEIIEKFGCEYCEDAFKEEHSIEVQVPFIKNRYENVKIIPVLIGNDDVNKTMQIIKHYYPDKDNAFVISSDLSHFLTDEAAKKTDIITARMIEDKQIQGFRFEQACGAVPICALTQFCLENNYSLIRVGMLNSSEVTGDVNRVVGYGSWFLYEKEKNVFIKEHLSAKVISIVKKTIDEKLKGKSEINVTEYLPFPPVLSSDGASFVSLKLNGNLRGCIGSVIPHTMLLLDLIKNSYNAAFADPRFKPLTREEFDKVKISVSLLTSPQKIIFSDEKDLLNQINPGIDGIIIRDKANQAVYLPTVWDILPEKTEFLNSLKEKAGLSKDHFSTTFEAYRFSTSEIE